MLVSRIEFSLVVYVANLQEHVLEAALVQVQVDVTLSSVTPHIHYTV